MTTKNPTFESLKAELEGIKDSKSRSMLQQHFETSEGIVIGRPTSIEHQGYEVAKCLNCGQATIRAKRNEEHSSLREYCGRWACKELR